VKVSLMWEEHYRVGFWKQWEGHQYDANCRIIIICGFWQPWRSISGGMLSQLPEDLTVCGLNKEDPGGAPLPPAVHLQGRHVTGCQQRGVCEAEVCVVSEAMSFEVSIAMKIYIVIMWVRTLCSCTGGYQPGSCSQLCYSEMLGILL
jgi:hypothetical protein